MNSDSSKIKKIYCNTCNHKTNHQLLSSHIRFENDEEVDGYGEPVWYDSWKYIFFKCRGCDTGILEVKYSNREIDSLIGYDVDNSEYMYFPERKNKLKRKPKEFKHIDKKLNSTYKEIIEAYHSGLNVVCAMGIRALLEGICSKEGIPDSGKTRYLTNKIKALEAKNNIQSGIIEGLTQLKFIGDGAAHRLNKTSGKIIDLSIDLLEAFMNSLYEAKFDLEHKADLLNKHSNTSKT